MTHPFTGHRLFAAAVTAISTGCTEPAKPPAVQTATPFDAPVASRVLAPASSVSLLPSGPPRAFGCDFEVTLTPDTTRFLIDEPVFMTFRVTTTCPRKLAIDIPGGDDNNTLGRPESYKVHAVSAAGVSVQPIDIGWGFGGLSGGSILDSTHPFERRLLIAHYVTFPNAGTYTLTVEKDLHLAPSAGDRPYDSSAPFASVPLQVSTTVNVLPSSHAALGAVIEARGKELSLDGPRAWETERALAIIHDVRVVPYLQKLTGAKNPTVRRNAAESLRSYVVEKRM